MRDECIGIPPRFECEMCPSKFRRKYHLVRHLNARHGIAPSDADDLVATPMRSEKGAKSDYASQNVKTEYDSPSPCGSGNNEALDLALPSASTSSSVGVPMTTAAAHAAAAAAAAAVMKNFSVEAIMMKNDLLGIGGAAAMAGVAGAPGLNFFQNLQEKLGLKFDAETLYNSYKMNSLEL